jgi:pyridoxal phosphate enzyme (YggS family)
MADNFEYIEKNLSEIRERINKAKLKRDNKSSGKEPRIMAVTKTVPAEKINFAVSRGISLIGENRVNELLEKYDRLDKDGLEIHFIGNLQTNKVKYIIDKVNVIQSVSSVKLAEEINKRAVLNNKIMDVLIEINAGAEESKIGINPADCLEFVSALRDFENIRICGFMTIPPFEYSGGEDRTKIKKVFDEMRGIYETVKLKKQDMKNISINTLSMGMSADFEEAVEHGSDIVRIGRGIFGERKYQ